MAHDPSFSSLGLAAPITDALQVLGYEEPTPVQVKSIPILLEGWDLLAQAQTGTGKTAAFALPILEKIDLNNESPQALIIAPTRELAMQVAEAIQSYAKHLSGFHVLPIYGGQEYRRQLKALKRGPHVVVGTPGRVMDHIRRGSLDISNTHTVVLDEADEMLNMGFIDDVTWILDQIKTKPQIALFSATMPKVIQEISKNYLKDPKKVIIKAKKSTAENIEQSYLMIAPNKKFDALLRFLEVEENDGTIIFTRTKTASSDLAQKLQAHGFVAEPLNGDMTQDARKKVVTKMKKGLTDILVATDVAARGLDIDRITHVINYDIPYDCETYTHRIGRTGRAGRKGIAILFATGKEERLLRAIERSTQSELKPIKAPSLKEINAKRESQFVDDFLLTMQSDERNLVKAQNTVDMIIAKTHLTIDDLAVACIAMLQKPAITGENEIPEDTAEAAPKKKKRKYGSSKKGSSNGGGNRRSSRSSSSKGGAPKRGKSGGSKSSSGKSGGGRSGSGRAPGKGKSKPARSGRPKRR